MGFLFADQSAIAKKERREGTNEKGPIIIPEVHAIGNAAEWKLLRRVRIKRGGRDDEKLCQKHHIWRLIKYCSLVQKPYHVKGLLLTKKHKS